MSRGIHRRLELIVRWSVCLLLCLLFCGASSAQSNSASATPTVTFTLDFPGAEPAHYVLTISSDGHAAYESNGKLDAETEAADLFQKRFTISSVTRDRIFDLAKRANYFDGKVDSGRKNLAFTGSKTLAYRDSERTSQATYNYSPLPAVQELTDLLQKLSTTLEFGHRLEYFYRFQKLALNDELKRMEELSVNHDLVEVAAVAPILQRIAKNQTVINVVRARAQRLLESASTGSR